MLNNTRPQRASYKRVVPDFLNPLHPSVFATVAAAVIALLSAVAGGASLIRVGPSAATVVIALSQESDRCMAHG